MFNDKNTQTIKGSSLKKNSTLPPSLFLLAKQRGALALCFVALTLNDKATVFLCFFFFIKQILDSKENRKTSLEPSRLSIENQHPSGLHQGQSMVLAEDSIQAGEGEKANNKR